MSLGNGNKMDTSVKNLISMGPLEDYFIYYDLRNQVFYEVKQGMNYSAIAAPIAVFSLQRLSKLLNQTFGDVSSPFNLLFFILMSLFLIFGTILLAKSTRRNMKTDRFRKVRLTKANIKTLRRKSRALTVVGYIFVLITIFSAYRYLAVSDFQFLIMYMLGIGILTYIVYDFRMKTRKRLFKELMETLQDGSRGKEGEM
ncbi:hypothetical protein [Streptococcus sp. GMD4S]|uniref:hypothetical protein n=2 Tax=Streptococcus TaxID=1301 RepID=UPI001ED99E2F|nr:hypothetical protein [Streptococcus sp. GMD4S]